MFGMNIVKNYDRLKMNWLAQSINSGNHAFRIQDTGYNFGTICIATGVGKSGVAIEDAIYRILNHDNKSKLVINVSCPILRLSQQFADEVQGTNFCNTFDTIFGKFYNAFALIDVHVNEYNVLWLGDCINPRTGLKGYEGEWTDDDFRKYFDITDSEWEEIERVMRPYL